VEKEVLRRKLLLRRARQREKDILAGSKSIEEKLFSLEEFVSADAIMFYVAKKEEVRTQDMIYSALEAGKNVVVPSLRLDKTRISPSLLLDYENELEEGMFGIPEPKAECIRLFPVEEIDIVLVPGVVFDKGGGRIGFGGGFYDEFLGSLPAGTGRWGLAFEFQVVEKVPLTDRDVPVERIITEERVINCKVR